MYDKEFLRKLDAYRTKTIYARVTALTLDELPIESIEGRVTQGSINLDGASALRRSCSLTMVAEKADVSDYYWGLNTKFKLEIGVKNAVDENYPEIIWFSQGIFILTTFSTALSTNNFTINLQGKDKMCLLNGEVGGSITAPTQFDSWEWEDSEGNWIIEKYPIKKIVSDAVHQYAGEPYHNIVINDIDDMGLELLEYRYDTDMFLFREENDDTYFNGTFNADTPCWYLDGVDWYSSTIGAKDKNDNYIHDYDPLVESLTDSYKLTSFKFNLDDETIYHIAKISYGQTAGFRSTDLIFPDDLIGNVGESITSVLDKIKNMLGEFEYFYDIDGRFIFQKKRNYINTVWTPMMTTEDGEIYVEGIAYADSEVYNFTENQLITAFNNSPNLNNLRNDYSVWGSRKGSSGAEIPIHMRYAIDEKPIYYKTFDGIEYCTEVYGNAKVEDWRELIFQMQKDYRKHNRDDDFELRIIQNNQPIEELSFSGYLNGKTGYEQYYIDLEGFWRQLYCPIEEIDQIFQENNEELQVLKDTLKVLQRNLENKQKLLAEQLELDSPNQDDIDQLKNEIKQINQQIISTNAKISKVQSEIDNLDTYYTYEKSSEGDWLTDIPEQHQGWARAIYESPESLNYWIDFLDADGELNEFSCKAVGNRPKAVNDSNVKSIYFRETPMIIFTADRSAEDYNPGYRYFQTQDIGDMFSVSTQGKSAKEAIDELLYQHSYCIETVTITSIPVYYLEPNTRIYVHDDNTGIDGDYIISKLTIPLSYNGTMSINATKAAERII